MFAGLALAIALNGSAPSCTGRDPLVAVPNAPHGLYVWNPYRVDGGKYEAALERDVIGKDPTLCGVSLVVPWADVEPANGTFDWSRIDGPNGWAAPYVRAGLTVNLLFAAGPERGKRNPVTPKWLDTPVVRCNAQPPAPDYISPKFEAAWARFIRGAVAHYSYHNSSIAPNIGYMRFAIGFGVEAIPAHFDTGKHKDCARKWAAVGLTYKTWVAHALRVVDTLGRQKTDKQLMVALNRMPGGPNFYDYPTRVAAAAAPRGVALGTENLGIANVATARSKPAPCNPRAKIVNLYWCRAFTYHAGKVPFEFQTIVASTAPQAGVSRIVLRKALQYGIANKAQIFELYPQEWLTRDAAHRAALRAAAAILGTK